MIFIYVYQSKEAGINYKVTTFPWSASYQSIVGDNASELLGEISLALEMDCDAEDIALTIHAHPTLHESVGMAAEIFDGTITDLPNTKAVKKKQFSFYTYILKGGEEL